jgi:hypothetical protein
LQQVEGMFEPIRDIIPVVRPRAADEILKQWVEHVSEPRRADFAKLWEDHYASVADYLAHKARHPDTHAGAMLVLHSWAPVVIGICSVLSCNPIVSIPALAVARERNRDYPKRACS